MMSFFISASHYFFSILCPVKTTSISSKHNTLILNGLLLTPLKNNEEGEGMKEQYDDSGSVKLCWKLAFSL